MRNTRLEDNSRVEDYVASPCVNRCGLNELAICRGCGRSRAEIIAWSKAAPEQQRLIVQAATQRRAAMSINDTE